MNQNKDLIREVRIGFILQGTNLNKFCKQHHKHYGNARKALLGEWKGKKGLALRRFIIENALGTNTRFLSDLE